MLKRAQFAAAVSLLGFIISSCHGDETIDLELPEAEVRYHTKYLDVVPLSDAPVCAGTLAMMDAHVEYASEMLDLEPSGRIQIYLRQPGEPAPATWCPETSTGVPPDGCYWIDRDVVFTNFAAIPHEIVHAITDEVGSDSWWVEGAASGVSQSPTIHADFSSGWSDLRGENGHLSRWLIERYGGETYMQLYAHTRPQHAERAAVEASVREILGVGFDELLSEYAAAAPYYFPDHWLCYVPPDSIETPWLDDVWETEVDLDCDRSNTFSFGGDAGRETLSARIPITIPHPGSYHFIADREDAEVFIQRCHDEPTDTPPPGVQKSPRPVLPLQGAASTYDAGPHVLIVDLPPGEPTTVRLMAYAAVTL